MSSKLKVKSSKVKTTTKKLKTVAVEKIDKSKAKVEKKTASVKVSKSASTVAKVSSFAKATEDKMVDNKNKVDKKKTSPAHSMEELLKSTGYKFQGLKRGENVEGVVTDIKGKSVFVDIGAKTEGVVLSKEYEEICDYIAKLKIGDKIRVVIYSPENDKGQILLSIKQAAIDHRWQIFEKALKTGEAIEVRGLEVNRGGLIVRYMGVRGFVPSSQFGHQYLGSLDQLQNRLFKAKVIEVDKEKNRLIFSEKAISEAQAMTQKKEALKMIKVGGTYKGMVSGVMPFGIFVRVEVDNTLPKAGKPEVTSLYLEGLVHISEISWEKVTDLNKLYKSGSKVDVKVLSIDEVAAKLNLSIKQLSMDPWMEAVKKYSVDKKTKGVITRLASFGAFVELQAGVEGLIHISKIPADYSIDVGKKVDVYVEAIEADKRRMSLGLVLTEKPVGYK